VHPSSFSTFLTNITAATAAQVLERSWKELMTYLDTKSGDLDLLISAHNRYLNSITTRGLLASSNHISTMLLDLFRTIIEGMESVGRVS
jgi:hypothetical protein